MHFPLRAHYKNMHLSYDTTEKGINLHMIAKQSSKGSYLYFGSLGLRCSLTLHQRCSASDIAGNKDFRKLLWAFEHLFHG